MAIYVVALTTEKYRHLPASQERLKTSTACRTEALLSSSGPTWEASSRSLRTSAAAASLALTLAGKARDSMGHTLFTARGEEQGLARPSIGLAKGLWIRIPRIRGLVFCRRCLAPYSISAGSRVRVRRDRAGRTVVVT